MAVGLKLLLGDMFFREICLRGDYGCGLSFAGGCLQHLGRITLKIEVFTTALLEASQYRESLLLNVLLAEGNLLDILQNIFEKEYNGSVGVDLPFRVGEVVEGKSFFGVKSGKVSVLGRLDFSAH